MSAVHILLPPSEGKHPGGRGRPLTVDGPLGAAREQLLDALDKLLTEDPPVAAAALLLPPGVAADALEKNRNVRTSRTVPALRRYGGVVYDGLDAAGLSPAAATLAGRSIHVFSGLLGVVRGDEAVPDYRVPAKAALPGLGIAGTFWRPVLSEVLPQRFARGLVLDLRSSDYTAMWKPDERTAGRVVTVRVLSPAPSGKQAVISFNSKYAKGRLAAALLEASAAGRPVGTIEDVAREWEGIGERAEQTGRTHLELYTGPWQPVTRQRAPRD